MADRKLSHKQQAFIAEYLKDKNATQAAIRAGYSKKTADAIGKENLRKPPIHDAIESALNKVNQDAGLEATKLRREIARLAFSDPRGILHADGRIKMPHELDDDTAAAIASFEVDKDGAIKYKFWDKNSAQERASKILGIFEKDNEQKNSDAAAFLLSINNRIVGVAE